MYERNDNICYISVIYVYQKYFYSSSKFPQTVLYQDKKTILISALLYHRRAFQRTTSPSSNGMIRAKELFPDPGMLNLPFLSHRVKSVTNEITKTRAAINFFGRPRFCYPDHRNRQYRKMPLYFLREAELLVGKKLGQARNLFVAQQFVFIHTDIFHNPAVRHAGFGEFRHDFAH